MQVLVLLNSKKSINRLNFFWRTEYQAISLSSSDAQRYDSGSAYVPFLPVPLHPTAPSDANHDSLAAPDEAGQGHYSHSMTLFQ